MVKKAGVTGIDTLLIQVSDVGRSLAFWRDGLGLPFKDAGTGDEAVYAKIGASTLMLHPDFNPSRMKGVKRGAGIAIHLKVGDADAYYQDIQRRGVKATEKPENRPWGREFSVVDPDGYVIDILGPIKGGSPAP